MIIVSPFHPPFQDSNLAPVSPAACPIAAKSQHRRCRRGLWSQALCLRIKTLRTTTTSGLLWMFPKKNEGVAVIWDVMYYSGWVTHFQSLISTHPQGVQTMMEHDLEQRWTKCRFFEHVLWDYPGTWVTIVTLVKIMGQIWSSSFSPLGLRSKGQTAHSTSQEGYSLTWWTHHDVAAKKHRKKVTTITTNIILQHYLASSSPSIKK